MFGHRLPSLRPAESGEDEDSGASTDQADEAGSEDSDSSSEEDGDEDGGSSDQSCKPMEVGETGS